MAVPKRKTGRSVTRSRRANWKISAPAIVECPQCKSKKLAHRVCKKCGFYAGENVLGEDIAK